ncbi:protein of unknown function [Desulfacinum hydrothermale DSM 13146]|uniref:DUF4301 domain-containing protein n=1 Tax=Desulfacinum hydrothermale DSM 13146 TaxID=1121390 RepID=A0A1W1XV46_9BACT|nr:DUF4301 family protein [Desulfacinum hydrothermale]SMC27732.1 protein of unknown function [Desulfacinum hydrothermale DSM 13146]
MDRFSFSQQDRNQLAEVGISTEEVQRQLELFARQDTFWDLHRPCTLGDGILTVDGALEKQCLEAYHKASRNGRYLKFVPASGAATRMFQALFAVLNEDPVPRLERLQERADGGDEAARSAVRFVKEAQRFAFYEAWKARTESQGCRLDQALKAGDLERPLRLLLTEEGLGLGRLPKALIPFHRYDDHVRTALEEHLVEAAHYVRNAHGACRLHFTVSPEHEDLFREHVDRVRPVHEGRLNTQYAMGFSHQSPSTHTIAVDEHNRPFRDAQGRLVFRPAGHGALLGNLSGLDGDLVYIKNIDNVVPDHLKGETLRWKRILGGLAVLIQQQVHAHIKRLRAVGSRNAVEDARRFVQETFGEAGSAVGGSLSAQRDLILDALDRPMRVCGMVRNVGEPGGGPFWVRNADGRIRMQIVEKAQVNMDDPAQRAIWSRSTHFNPVDLVCALRDPDGKPYDLQRYVDPNAVIITRKSLEGRPLKALELPGLWNGSMAFWNTLFVQVPTITFNPVKTVLDLLRSEHQPRGRP